MNSINKEMTADEIRGAEKILSMRADNQNGEQWKHYILGYFVSNYGRVYNYFGHDLKESVNEVKVDKHGNIKKTHKVFYVCKDGVSKKQWIHKVVYLLFGCFPESVVYPEGILNEHSSYKVHHINSDCQFNFIGNLYLMLDKWHGKLNSDLYYGKIKQSDVDTVAKLNDYVRMLDNSIQWYIA